MGFIVSRFHGVAVAVMECPLLFHSGRGSDGVSTVTVGVDIYIYIHNT